MRKALFGLLVVFCLAIFAPTSVHACNACDVTHDEAHEMCSDTIIEVTIMNPYTLRVLVDFIADPTRPLDVQIEENVHVAKEILIEEAYGITDSEFNHNLDFALVIPSVGGCTNPLGHMFFSVDGTESTSSAGSHTVLIRITYTNPVTGWTSSRYEQRDCFMTLRQVTTILQCNHCGVTSSVVTNIVMHSLC